MAKIQIGHLKFPRVFCAPGTLGFFGEGYPFHKILQRIPGYTTEGLGFVSKTVTAHFREGNMPFKDDGMTPSEILPKSIKVYWFSGHIVNAVGLSNRGIKWAVKQKRWQQRQEPFMVSFMSLAEEIEDKIEELRFFAQTLKEYDPQMWEVVQKIVAIQINFACPNTGQDPIKFLDTVIPMLEAARKLFPEIPIVANFNPFVPIDILLEIQEKKLADGLWIANTIPWDTRSTQTHHEGMRIPWEELCPFGNDKTPISPLVHRGLKQGGGLSGKYVLPFVLRTVQTARNQGITLPIIAGNGIQSKRNAKRVFDAGADGIALGSIFILRPWRLRGIIKKFS